MLKHNVQLFLSHEKRKKDAQAVAKDAAREQ